MLFSVILNAGPFSRSYRKNINKWSRDHSDYILAKNAAAFCSCPKNLPEAELKSFGLIALAKEISR